MFFPGRMQLSMGYGRDRRDSFIASTNISTWKKEFFLALFYLSQDFCSWSNLFCTGRTRDLEILIPLLYCVGSFHLLYHWFSGCRSSFLFSILVSLPSKAENKPA